MKTLLAGFAMVALVSPEVSAQQSVDPSAVKMADAANALLSELNDKQKSVCQFRLEDPERLNWHFIPRARKGLAFRDLEGKVFQSARSLLAVGLSGAGYAISCFA